MKFNLVHQLKRRHSLAGLGLIGLDVAFFSLTNPEKVSSGLLIVGFLLVALSIYGLLRLVLAIASIYGLPLRDRGRRAALFLGVSCASAVALQSLGELTLRDEVVLALLSLLAYVYVSYGRPRPHN